MIENAQPKSKRQRKTTSTEDYEYEYESDFSDEPEMQDAVDYVNFEYGEDEGDSVVDLSVVSWVRNEVVDRRSNSSSSVNEPCIPSLITLPTHAAYSNSS